MQLKKAKRVTRDTKMKADIFKAAVHLANIWGLFQFTRFHVSQGARTSECSVTWHFGTMQELRTAIVKHAAENELIHILADARRGRNPIKVPLTAALNKKLAKHTRRIDQP